MRRVRPLILLLALAACKVSEDILITDTNPPLQSTWEATVTGLPARPEAAGTVNIDHFLTHFVLNANLSGLVSGTQYQWRLWFGTCAARIAGWGPNANPPAYTVIVADANGNGTGTATLNGRLRTDSTYHVRLYIARTGPVDTTWYACGNVQQKP
jgi:hypothetical protein